MINEKNIQEEVTTKELEALETIVENMTCEETNIMNESLDPPFQDTAQKLRSQMNLFRILFLFTTLLITVGNIFFTKQWQSLLPGVALMILMDSSILPDRLLSRWFRFPSSERAVAEYLIGIYLLIPIFKAVFF